VTVNFIKLKDNNIIILYGLTIWKTSENCETIRITWEKQINSFSFQPSSLKKK